MPEIVTGKPISIGGSVFRHEATGAGVVMVIARACERLGWKLAEQRCIVQGFGNVGGIAAQELVDRGATVVGVSDISGGIHDPAGLEHPDDERLRDRELLPRGWETGSRITNEELLELDCDILVLAAREDRSTSTTRHASAVAWWRRARMGRPRSKRRAILREREIHVLPDTSSRTPAA